MRKICTFNLPIDLVKEMNQEIRRGYRSKFVETAIDEKLKRKAEFDLHDFKAWELLNHVELFRYSSLTKMEVLFLRELVDKLKEKGA